MEISLSISFSHSFNFTVYINGQYYFYEFDKILGRKYLHWDAESLSRMCNFLNFDNFSYTIDPEYHNVYFFYCILKIINFILNKKHYGFIIKTLILVDSPVFYYSSPEDLHFLQENSVYTELENYEKGRDLLGFLIDIWFDNFNQQIKHINHHATHAYSGLYYSDYQEALIVTIDGQGNYTKNIVNDEVKEEYIGRVFMEHFGPEYGFFEFQVDYMREHFVIWHAKKDKFPIMEKLINIHSRVGHYYERTAYIMDMYEASPGDDNNDNLLTPPGKIMGLSSYGDSSPTRVHDIKSWMKNGPIDVFMDEKDWIETSVNYPISNRKAAFARYNYIKGFEQCADFAHDLQDAFNELVYEYVEPYINKFKLPVIISGGCALNVITNQFFLDKGIQVSISPCPSDGGNSLGAMFHFHPPKEVPSVYIGVDIMDRNDFEIYNKHYNPEEISIEGLVSLLIKGKIIGIVNGRSEVGPRALGNRSIICDPSFPDMKDILNKKVKFREEYRPFAPVVRYEDRDKYFNFTHESPYMSFCPTVRSEYWDKIPSVVHVDKTARVQTVRKEQHELFYNIMTEMEQVGKVPIILNTSFNTKGKPILVSLKEALNILENTELDYVYCEGLLYSKNTILFTTLEFKSNARL